MRIENKVSCKKGSMFQCVQYSMGPCDIAEQVTSYLLSLNSVKKIVHVIFLTPRHHYSMCPCTIDWSLKTTLILSIKVICCKLIWNDNLASTFVYS